MVERDFPEVMLIRRCTNGGFARAVNTGVMKDSADCEFIGLLNSDTIVESGWLDLAVEVIRRNKRVGAVAPRVVLHDDPSVIDSAGQGYTAGPIGVDAASDTVRRSIGASRCSVPHQRRARTPWLGVRSQ